MAGHIQERGNGSYLLVYHIGYDADGKRMRKTKTVKAKNKSEAKRALAQFVSDIDAGEHVSPSHIKLNEYVKIWKHEHYKKVSPYTKETYDNALNTHILPGIGHIKLESIKPTRINNFIEDMEEKGLSSSTIMKSFNALNSIFKLAVKNEILMKNPIDKVDRPSVVYKEGNVYDSEELKQLYHLLNKEENIQMVLIIKLALLTGMRKGEILALQSDDLDFSTNTIHINKTLIYTKETGYTLKEPKTKGSNRKVAPPRKFMDELKKHMYRKKTERMEAAELWEGGEHFFLFSSDLGKPLHRDSPNRWWRRFLERNNFKKIRFHDLRHTAATDLINKQVDAHSISKRLGHSKINTTMNLYGHYLEEADQKIADILDDDYI